MWFRIQSYFQRVLWARVHIHGFCLLLVVYFLFRADTSVCVWVRLRSLRVREWRVFTTIFLLTIGLRLLVVGCIPSLWCCGESYFYSSKVVLSFVVVVFAAAVVLVQLLLSEFSNRFAFTVFLCGIHGANVWLTREYQKFGFWGYFLWSCVVVTDDDFSFLVVDNDSVVAEVCKGCVWELKLCFFLFVCSCVVGFLRFTNLITLF